MNNLLSMPQTASVQEIQRNYRKLLNNAKSTRQPIFILCNNSPEAVIIDLNSWDEIIAQIQEAELFESIRIAHEEFKNGKVKVLKGKLSDLMKNREE